MAENGMVLRNLALVGHTKSAPLPPERRPVFEEGVALLFGRWTALQLAVENEWGGHKSAEKAQTLLLGVLDWFYAKRNHEMLDLEDILEEALQTEFNVQAEDGSPFQVSRNLVNWHNQAAAGDLSYLEYLRGTAATAAAATAQCQREPGAEGMGEDGGGDGDDSSSSGSDSGGSGDEGGEGGEGGGEGGGDDMEVDDEPAPPAVDADGFQTVTRKGGRSGGRR